MTQWRGRRQKENARKTKAEGKRREAGEITVTAMATFYACALLVTAMGFAFTEPLLDLLGAVGDIRPHARTYFRIILAGNVLSTGFSSIIRAEGKVGYAALIWVIPVTVNIILDAVFIFALDWGVAGSAAATLACQFTSGIMSIVFFARFSSQTLKNARPHLAKVADILSVGVLSLVQMGSLSLLFTLANYKISKIDGALGVTAFGYVGKLATYAAARLHPAPRRRHSRYVDSLPCRRGNCRPRRRGLRFNLSLLPRRASLRPRSAFSQNAGQSTLQRLK